MKVSDIESKYQEDFDDVDAWVKNRYEDVFAPYFYLVQELYKRMQSTTRQITDKELEEILSTVPLQMFAVAEELNNVKARMEVLKLEIKQKKNDIRASSTETSQTARNKQADEATAEDELLLKLYRSIVERVESQVSFSKELIMSAKKLWTSRRDAENIAQAAQNTELPDYSIGDSDSKQSYIK